MSSLHPGVLFNNAGLNKRYTALSPHKTEQEHSQRSSVTCGGGQILPKPSPVSRVYDVPNSSSRLILLNNKLTKKSMGSRLRGQTEFKGDINHPQPERHLSDTPGLNKRHHQKCAVSESERFLPSITPSVSPSSDSRSSTKQSAGKGVVKSHDCCLEDYEIIKLFDKLQRPPRLSAGRPHSLPTSFSSFIDVCSLKHGERHYLASIAQIYGVEHMRQQKIQQYNQLMWNEISKGNYSSKEVNKYFKYLSRPHSVGGVAGHVSSSPKQSHTSPSRRPKSHGNQKKERAPTEHSGSWTAVKHSHKKWDFKENRSNAKRKESKHADRNKNKKTQLEKRNPTKKAQQDQITDESITTTRETIKQEDSSESHKCSSESRSEKSERKGLKANKKKTKTQDMKLDRTSSSDDDDSDSSLSNSEDDSTVDNDSDTETETKCETYTERDETNLKESSFSDRIKSDSYSEQETETILSRDSETDLNIESHQKRKNKVGINKISLSSSDKEVSSESESEQENIKKKNSSNEDDLSFSGSENDTKYEQNFRSDLGKESKTNIEEDSKDDLANESKTDLEEDSKPDLEKESKTVIEEESKVDLVNDSKTDLVNDSNIDLVKESKTNLEEESKSDLEKESKTNIEEDSKDDLVKESKTNFEEESMSDLEKESKTDIEEKSVNLVNDSKTDLVKESKNNLEEESKSEFEETHKTDLEEFNYDLLKESKTDLDEEMKVEMDKKPELYTENTNEMYEMPTSANQDNINSLQSNEEIKIDENRNFDANKESDITTKEMILNMETQSHDHDYQVNITAENNDSAQLKGNADVRDSHTQESSRGDIADNSDSETNCNSADRENYSGQNLDNQESINLVENETPEVFRTSADSSLTLDNNVTQEQDAKLTQHDAELSINEVIDPNDAVIETNTGTVNIESQGPTSHNESHENIESKRHGSSSSSSDDGLDSSSSDDSISDSSDDKDLETESPSTTTQDKE